MAGEKNALPLIRTKLHRPRVSDDLIPRPHLMERLNEGLDRKLTLVSAPAGFGKTTPVASWQKRHEVWKLKCPVRPTSPSQDCAAYSPQNVRRRR